MQAWACAEVTLATSRVDAKAECVASRFCVVAFVAIICVSSAACGPESIPGGFSPFTPTPASVVVGTCSTVPAQGIQWRIAGLEYIRWEQLAGNVVATLKIGYTYGLRIAGHVGGEDCSSKIETVEWVMSNPAVVRVDPESDRLRGTLVAQSVGETQLAARMDFRDGSPALSSPGLRVDWHS